MSHATCPTRRRVVLLSTGGTIEKTYDEVTGLLENRASIVDRMLRRLRLEGLELRTRALMSKDSNDLTDEDRAAIVEAVWTEVTDGDGSGGAELAGVVILHGTDTLSVTGEALYAALVKRANGQAKLRVPVVLTGAMRPFEMRRSDSLQNLTESIFAAGLLDAGVWCVAHGRALRFPGVVKDRVRGTFVDG